MFHLAPSAQNYWDIVSGTYDRDVTGSLTGMARRQVVWQHLLGAFVAGQRVLELNCGTGVDAVHLAQRGIRLIACDISAGMIAVARRRVLEHHLADLVDLRVLATEDIALLGGQAPFDGAFSNFSGLNCVRCLSRVAYDLSRLLRPGAALVVCMVGRLVPWEIVWFLIHGSPTTALRRLRSSGVETEALEIRYFSRREIHDSFAPYFTLKEWKGLGIAVPPTYMESWARRFPGVTRTLTRADRVLGAVPLVRNLGDSVLLHFERKGTASWQ